MFVIYTLVSFVIFIYFAYYYFTRSFKYWQSRNIPGPQPVPFFGNFKEYALRKSTAPSIHKQIYDDYPNEKVVGFYRMTRPSLLIRDLDVVKNVLIKDFEYFEDRGIDFSVEHLGANLFHADAKIWRPLRNRFSPLFTIGKLKNMIPLINERADLFINHVKNITEKKGDQEIYTLVKKFTVSSIMACAFGVDINEDSGKLIQKMNEIDHLTFSRNISVELDLFHPGILKKLNSSIFQKGISKFFLKLINDVLQARNGVPSTRNDLIDLVLELKNKGNYVKLTNEVIAAQAFIFYVAGYETSAITMAFMLYELAMNPPMQEKIIAEVDEVLSRHDGKITYDIISELSYMDKVFNETLRKYPLSADIVRRAKSNYNIRGTDITIEKGISILVPVLGISHDEKYYPNPKKFDPERFSPENESKRHPCAFIPFGAGPRQCIGKLFGIIQSRVCMLKFFSNFRVEVSKNTPTTIIFDPQRVVNVPKGGIQLNILPRKFAE
ncbi:cytochrome P450 6B1-like [Maniola jurtina]|uniref:cytochrome P450 6B1-like n=1 Tax=Maniola jurtina TaxID=191418 RepID=UPI001E686799|nr:cytochrome P450 6B1-like [Maniola jurtina]